MIEQADQIVIYGIVDPADVFIRPVIDRRKVALIETEPVIKKCPCLVRIEEDKAHCVTDPEILVIDLSAAAKIRIHRNDRKSVEIGLRIVMILLKQRKTLFID